MKEQTSVRASGRSHVLSDIILSARQLFSNTSLYLRFLKSEIEMM
jgi:hypothetical protein